jgi:hypothetical protein
VVRLQRGIRNARRSPDHGAPARRLRRHAHRVDGDSALHHRDRLRQRRAGRVFERQG